MTHSNVIRNKQGSIIIDIQEIHNISKYSKCLYSSKLQNLKEMNAFLGPAKPPKWSQKDVNDLNRDITDEEIEIVRKRISAKNVQDQVDSQQSSTRHSKKMHIHSFLNHLKRKEGRNKKKSEVTVMVGLGKWGGGKERMEGRKFTCGAEERA